MTKVAVGFVILLASVACGGGDQTGSAAPTTPSPPSSTTPTSTSTTSTPPAAEERPGCGVTGSSPTVFDGSAGVYATAIVELDPGGPSLAFDVVQWLVGDEAFEAYAADHPDDPTGPPNDYYIVNESGQVRTAVLSPDAPVWLVDLAVDSDADVDLRTLGDLANHLAASRETIYWLTFDAGTIVDVCEQYRP